jgi:ABC-2 type transport system ATP-binding protein
VLGFLGPNGAGKTTAIRILTTILEPDAGHFFVAGISSDYPDRVRRRIGVLPETLGFSKHTTGLELLIYFGRHYGLTVAEAQTKARALLDEVGLGQRARSLIGSYSRGMRQRLGIARALVNDPAVVFLDEPTLGLDPRGQQELLALVQQIARDHHAGVVLCSHILSEVERVCHDVVILSGGQVVAKGPVSDVIGRAQRDVIQRNAIRVRVPPPSVGEARRLLEAMANGVKLTIADERAGWLGVEFASPNGGDPPEEYRIKNSVLDVLVRAQIPVLNFEAAGGRLQDVFLELTDGASE